MKPELLPSAAPSVRDFFLNGKDQSLKLVQRSFSSSAGMVRAVPSFPGSGSGRKTFPWDGVYRPQLHLAVTHKTHSWVYGSSENPFSKKTSRQDRATPGESAIPLRLRTPGCASHVSLGGGSAAAFSSHASRPLRPSHCWRLMLLQSQNTFLHGKHSDLGLFIAPTFPFSFSSSFSPG